MVPSIDGVGVAHSHSSCKRCFACIGRACDEARARDTRLLLWLQQQYRLFGDGLICSSPEAAAQYSLVSYRVRGQGRAGVGYLAAFGGGWRGRLQRSEGLYPQREGR